MPVSANERPIGSLVLADNKSKQIFEVEMNGAIRWILAQVRITYSTGANAPVYVKDDILNWMSSLQVRLNGKPLKTDLDGLSQFLKEQFLKGAVPYKEDPVTTVNTANAVCGWDIILDFARFPLRDDDISALLQTGNLSNLEIVINTDSFASIATVAANAPTFVSAKIDFEIRDYSGDIKGQDINDDTQVKMTNVLEQIEGISLEANKTQFDANSQEIPLKSGAGILQHLIIVKDDGVRSGNRVTDIKFARTKGQRFAFLERAFKSILQKNKIDYGFEERVDGTIFIDWTEKLGFKTGFITGARSDEVMRLLTDGINITQDKIYVITRYV